MSITLRYIIIKIISKGSLTSYNERLAYAWLYIKCLILLNAMAFCCITVFRLQFFSSMLADIILIMNLKICRQNNLYSDWNECILISLITTGLIPSELMKYLKGPDPILSVHHESVSRARLTRVFPKLANQWIKLHYFSFNRLRNRIMIASFAINTLLWNT